MKTKTKQGKMPQVEWNGQWYSLTSRKTEIPDFTAMSRMAVLVWLNRNTRARGYSKPTVNIAFGGAIKVN